jgi:hypothetical protein
VAKLDRSKEDQWSQALSKTLSEAVSSGRLPGRDLATLKALTVVKLLDDFAMIDFFVNAAREPAMFEEYPTYLMTAELYVRVEKAESVWKHVPEEAKGFLKSLRESSRFYKADDDAAEVEERRTEARGLDAFKAEVKKTLEAVAPDAQIIPNQVCGPYLVDFFFQTTNTILELAPEFQFFHKTQRLTATAKLRHQLLRAMGFKVVLLPYYDWTGSDEEHSQYITNVVLPAVLDK